MITKIYSMSFTSGTLLYHETIIVAQLYAELSDWNAVRTLVIDENRLQMRTLNASKRIYREVASRLKQLTAVQHTLLLQGDRPEKLALLWLAVCKRYRFIYDFAVEVVRENFLRLDMALTHQAYDNFFHDKAEWHPEVSNVAASTQAKQRQVIFKMMREADLLSSDNKIQPILLAPRLIKAISQDDPHHLAIFPVLEADIQYQLRNVIE